MCVDELQELSLNSPTINVKRWMDIINRLVNEILEVSTVWQLKRQSIWQMLDKIAGSNLAQVENSRDKVDTWKWKLTDDSEFSARNSGNEFSLESFIFTFACNLIKTTTKTSKVTSKLRRVFKFNFAFFCFHSFAFVLYFSIKICCSKNLICNWI